MTHGAFFLALSRPFVSGQERGNDQSLANYQRELEY